MGKKEKSLCFYRLIPFVCCSFTFGVTKNQSKVDMCPPHKKSMHEVQQIVQQRESRQKDVDHFRQTQRQRSAGGGLFRKTPVDRQVMGHRDTSAWQFRLTDHIPKLLGLRQIKKIFWEEFYFLKKDSMQKNGEFWLIHKCENSDVSSKHPHTGKLVYFDLNTI